MTTEDFIIELFCRVDDQMDVVPKHSQASLYPSEVVARAVCRKSTRSRGFLPRLPEAG